MSLTNSLQNNYNTNKYDVNNCKKILCYNVINNKACTYGNKCMYAHTLAEQRIEPLRHKAYMILKNNNNLSKLDLVNDEKLFKTLLQLTRICMTCAKNMCPGGYNCRNGAIGPNFRICYNDLMSGNCNKMNCQSIHLTERKLVPYNLQKKMANMTKYNSSDEFSDDNTRSQSSSSHSLIEIEKDDKLNVWKNIPKTIFQDNINKEIINKPKQICSPNLDQPARDIRSENYTKYEKKDNTHTKHNKKYNKKQATKKQNDIFMKCSNAKILKDISGIFLTEEFLKNKFNYTDSSSSEENIDTIIKYMNEDSDDSDNNSIFKVRNI